MYIMPEQHVLDEKQLKKLNEYLNGVIEERENLKIDWEKIQYLMEQFCMYRPRPYDEEEIVPSMKKEEIIAIVLDFYKSFGPNVYEKVKNAIFQLNGNIKTKIYNVHSIKEEEFDVEDEDGLPKYSKESSVDTLSGKATVHIPLDIEQATGTIQRTGSNATIIDLYALTHEIAHLLDLKLSEYDGPNHTRELLGETTAFSFEIALTDYLLKLGTLPREAIVQQYNENLDYLGACGEEVHMLLCLSDEKMKKQMVTEDFLQEYMKKYGLPLEYVRFTIYKLVESKASLVYQKRYAIAGMLAPTIAKKMQEPGGIARLETYLREAQNDNYEKAIEAFGIEESDDGIQMLLANLNEQFDQINDDPEIER